MQPREAFAEGAVLRFKGAGLREFATLHREKFVCLVGRHETTAELLRREEVSWPLLCRPPPLQDMQGRPVRVQLGMRDGSGSVKAVGPAFQLQVLLTPRVRELSPGVGVIATALPLALHLAHPPPWTSKWQAHCDFGAQLGYTQARLHGAYTMHCITPVAPEVVEVPLTLVFLLTTEEPLLVQRLEVPVLAADEGSSPGLFILAPPPPSGLPVIRAVPPASAPIGSGTLVEWRSEVPVFEVMAVVPYRCVWEGTAVGDVSTAVIALAPTIAKCAAPVATSPLVVALRLEDPTGRTVVGVPVFQYFTPLRGSWWMPGEPVAPHTLVRFETGGEPLPAFAYGRPTPGVPIECRFDRLVYPPAVVDADGVECEVPALPGGRYALSLLQDHRHDSNRIFLTLRGSQATAAGKEPRLDAAAAPLPPLEIVPAALVPDRGPTGGGTFVTVMLGRPWPRVPRSARCHFADYEVDASVVYHDRVGCLTPPITTPQVVEVRVTVEDQGPHFGEVVTLPFVFYDAAQIESVLPAASPNGGVEVIVKPQASGGGLPTLGGPQCRVGTSVVAGEVLDDRTVRCPLPEVEKRGLRFEAAADAEAAHSSGSGVATGSSLQEVLEGVRFAVRGVAWPHWYLHAAPSDGSLFRSTGLR
jgi:hypothetical protein